MDISYYSCHSNCNRFGGFDPRRGLEALDVPVLLPQICPTQVASSVTYSSCRRRGYETLRMAWTPKLQRTTIRLGLITTLKKGGSAPPFIKYGLRDEPRRCGAPCGVGRSSRSSSNDSDIVQRACGRARSHSSPLPHRRVSWRGQKYDRHSETQSRQRRAEDSVSKLFSKYVHTQT